MMKSSFFKSSSGSSRLKPSARQSIRGKISGPIPIANPLDEDEFPIRKPGTSVAATKPPSDDEFPIRRPGNTIVASPPPVEGKEAEVLGQLGQQAQSSQDSAADVSEGHVEVQQSNVPEPPSDPPPAPPPGAGPPPASGPVGPGASPPRHRANPSSTLRYSQISAASTGITGQSGDRPERKKSTLRNALSKLFGRKKKPGSQASVSMDAVSTLAANRQHRSVGHRWFPETPAEVAWANVARRRQDPSALSRSTDGEPKRSASLPITEYARALRSHSVGPDDMTAIESARNSVQAESSPSRRRAATLTTSRLFTRPRKAELSEWIGLSPRPASAHGRGSRHLSAAYNDDPDMIGRAITSDSLAEPNSHRRRSRSLSGIQDMADGRPPPRRRSDEIRYWRESYDPGFLSPLSSAHDVHGDHGDHVDFDDTGAVSLSVPDSPHVDRPPKTPPQPFVFGSIASMNEMAGMRITQVASMESRIGTLETRMLKLERVVDQLCHAVSGFKGPFVDFSPESAVPRSVPPLPEPSYAYSTAAPPMIPAIYQTISSDTKGGGSSNASAGGRPSSPSRYSVDTDADATSHMSFGEGQTYIGSLHPPSSAATQPQGLLLPAAPSSSSSAASAHRPTSTSTVRGTASLPALGANSHGGGDDLAAQLESERAARRDLEAQVRKLGERVNSLSSTMFAMVGGSGPAAKKARSTERLGATAAAAAVAASSSSSSSAPAPTASAGKRSVFEEGGDADDKRMLRLGLPAAAAAAGPRSGAETPRYVEGVEGATPLYGAFGEELRVEPDEPDPQRKKAARTLSLSQLTLGRGAQVQI